MTRQIDTETTARIRTLAYIDFLKTAFDLDDAGLAGLAGIELGDIERYREGVADELAIGSLSALAKLTGISCDWLCGY